MPEEAPSNAVLSTKLDALKDVITQNQITNHEAHTTIIAQVVKTNGRVTALEKFKNIAIGVLVVIQIILVAIVIPLVLSYLQK